MLTMLVCITTKLWAQEPYAVLSDDGLTVTFYYDYQKWMRGGMNINNSDIDWVSSSPYGTAKTAVIDASFADYSPTSTAYWFQNCDVTTITGIENIKTDNVTDMGGMFYGCYYLVSLDLRNFNTQNVTNMRSMFYGCVHLTSLDVSAFKTEKHYCPRKSVNISLRRLFALRF